MLNIIIHNGNANRNHYEIPIRMTTIKTFLKRKESNKYQQECGEIGDLRHCWQELKMVQLLWKSLTISQKIEPQKKWTPLSIWPSTSTPRYIPKKPWKPKLKTNTGTPMCIAALTATVKKWEQPKCFKRWMNKMWYVHTMVYYSAIRRNKTLKHAIV